MRNIIIIIGLVGWVAGCGATSSGGGAGYTGKPAGTACTAANAEGCVVQSGVVSRMTCDGTTWKLLENCPTGYTCSELAGSSGATTTKCNAPAVVQTTDTVSAGGELATLLNCMKTSCPSQWSTCMADPVCASVMNCATGCESNSAPETCLQTTCTSPAAKNNAPGKALSACAEPFCSKPVSVCGNGACEPGESNSSCPSDCKSPDAGATSGTCDSFADIKATSGSAIQSASQFLPAILNYCMASGGCGTTASGVSCVAGCVGDSYSKFTGFASTSLGCRTCIAQIAVCGAQKCATECATDTAPTCESCIEAVCGKVDAICKITWGK